MSTLEEAASRVFEDFSKITSAWLFGSHARGQAGPSSDVDIAILVTAPLTTDELVSLSSKLSWEMGQDRVDLVVLNDALPILAFEAISGVNILCRDAAAQAGFFSLVCRLYEEDMAMWQRGLVYRREAS
jgi:predicted nucleotidyltransferase